jgi:hypothetical protein
MAGMALEVIVNEGKGVSVAVRCSLAVEDGFVNGALVNVVVSEDPELGVPPGWQAGRKKARKITAVNITRRFISR